MLIDDLEGKLVTLYAPGGTKTANWSLTDAAVFNIQSVYEFLKPQPPLPKELFQGGLMHLPFPKCWFEYAANGWRFAALAYYTAPTEIVINYLCEEDKLKLSTGYTAWTLNIDENGILNVVSRTRGVSEQPNVTKAQGDPFFEATTACLHGAVAIYLLNWKQEVSSVLNPPSRQQKRHAQRTGTLPPKEFRNLIIAPWVAKFSSMKVEGAAEDSTGWEQRWHAVRGHSRTWTEDAPMYGCDKCRANSTGHGLEGVKSHVGTFWIASYFAGSKSLGEIEHRYETGVVPAAEFS